MFGRFQKTSGTKQWTVALAPVFSGGVSIDATMVKAVVMQSIDALNQRGLMPMHQKMLKIAVIGAAGFVVTYATLALVTDFLILPSLTVSGFLVLSAIASYAPPNGLPIALSLPLIVCVFSISLFLISSAFSAVPQRGGSVIIPLVATFTAFAALTIFGFIRPRSLERRP